MEQLNLKDELRKAKSKIVRIAAKDLAIHPLAQRDLIPSKLKQLTREMDLDAIGVLHAVQYGINGSTHYWVIDGQHRLKALMDLDLGEWMVEVRVHLGIEDDARASALFLKLNNRVAVCSFDKFKNEVQAGQDVALGTQAVVLSKGLKMTRQGADGSVCAVTAAKTAFSLDNGESLGLALDVILKAWGDSAAALEGRIIEGLSIVLNRNKENIDVPSLIKKLAKTPGPSWIQGRAQVIRETMKQSVTRCVANVIIATYNNGRSTNRLDTLF